MNLEVMIEAAKTWLANSFDPAAVSASLTGFLGSGYVGIIVVGLFVWGMVKKVFKLFLATCLCLIVYLMVTSHNYITVLDQLRTIIP